MLTLYLALNDSTGSRAVSSGRIERTVPHGRVISFPDRARTHTRGRSEAIRSDDGLPVRPLLVS